MVFAYVLLDYLVYGGIVEIQVFLVFRQYVPPYFRKVVLGKLGPFLPVLSGSRDLSSQQALSFFPRLFYASLLFHLHERGKNERSLEIGLEFERSEDLHEFRRKSGRFREGFNVESVLLEFPGYLVFEKLLLLRLVDKRSVVLDPASFVVQSGISSVLDLGPDVRYRFPFLVGDWHSVLSDYVGDVVIAFSGSDLSSVQKLPQFRMLDHFVTELPGVVYRYRIGKVVVLRLEHSGES